MRKLLTILNAMVRDSLPFSKAFLARRSAARFVTASTGNLSREARLVLIQQR